MPPSPISPSNFEKMISEWFEFATYNEIGFFVSVSNFGIAWRITQLKNDKALQQKLGLNNPKELLVFLDFNQEVNIDKKDFLQKLQQELELELNNKNANSILDSRDLLSQLQLLYQNSYHVNLLITGVDFLIKSGRLDVLKTASGIQERFPNIGLLFFVSSNLLNPKIKKKLFEKHSLAGNIFFITGYDRADSVQFIKYVEAKWRFKANPNQKQWLIDNCAGMLGLIKNGLRLIRSNPKISPIQISKDQSMLDRVAAVVDFLSPEEVANLRKINTTHKIATVPIYTSSYFKNIGLIQTDGKNWQLVPPFVNQNLAKIASSLDILPNKALIELSQTEQRVLATFMTQKNQILTREKIAELIWQSDVEDNYSDWALDQQISRLRKKLKNIELPFKLITKKRQGFLLSSE